MTLQHHRSPALLRHGQIQIPLPPALLNVLLWCPACIHFTGTKLLRLLHVCADTWFPNGTQYITARGTNGGLEGYISGTYQPVWDSWQRFIEPLVSHVPMLGNTGQHCYTP